MLKKLALLLLMPNLIAAQCCNLEFVERITTTSTGLNSVVFSFDGSCLVAGFTTSNLIRGFSVGADCSLATAAPDLSFAPNQLFAIAASPTDNCFVVVGQDTTLPNPVGIILPFRLENCVPIFNQLTPISSTVRPSTAAAFSPDGDCLVVGGQNNILAGVATTFSVGSNMAGNCTFTLVGPTVTTHTAGPFSPPKQFAFLPINGNTSCLFLVSQNSSTTTAQLVVDISDCSISLSGLNLDGNNIAASSIGCLAQSSPSSNRIDIYSPNNNCGVGALIENIAITNPQSVAFSADSSCLAIGNVDDMGNGQITLYGIDTATCEPTAMPLQTIATGSASIPSFLAFSANGCLAVGNADNSITMFRLSTIPTLTNIVATNNCGTVTVSGHTELEILLKSGMV